MFILVRQLCKFRAGKLNMYTLRRKLIKKTGMVEIAGVFSMLFLCKMTK